MTPIQDGFEIDLLRDLSSSTVITKLKRHFAVHGSPHKVFSDNGTQFSSQRFKEFAAAWDFTHTTSSPEYPQANGLAERAVRSAKHLMEKSRRDGSDVFQNLLNLRNIPRDETLGSPAERLMSRQTRTTLPISKSILVPASKDNVAVKTQLSRKRHCQKTYYDKSSRAFRTLLQGEIVRLLKAMTESDSSNSSVMNQGHILWRLKEENTDETENISFLSRSHNHNGSSTAICNFPFSRPPLLNQVKSKNNAPHKEPGRSR